MLMSCGAVQDEPSSRSDSEEEEQMVVYYGGPFAEGQEHTWAYLPELRSMWQKGEVNSKTKVWMDTPEFGEKWARLKKHAEESAPNPLLVPQAVHLDGSRGLGMLSACATTLRCLMPDLMLGCGVLSCRWGLMSPEEIRQAKQRRAMRAASAVGALAAGADGRLRTESVESTDSN